MSRRSSKSAPPAPALSVPRVRAVIDERDAGNGEPATPTPRSRTAASTSTTRKRRAKFVF